MHMHFYCRKFEYDGYTLYIRTFDSTEKSLRNEHAFTGLSKWVQNG